MTSPATFLLIRLALPLALAGCATTSYTPHPADDAAKLRLKLTAGGLFPTLHSTLRTVGTDRCGSPVRVPMLSIYTGPPKEPPGPVSNAAPPAEYPRAGMFESPDPLRNDTAELRLAPGNYLLTMLGAIGYSNCSVSTFVRLREKVQYQADFRFAPGSQLCTASISQLDERIAPPQWRPLPVASGSQVLCPDGNGPPLTPAGQKIG